MERDRVAGRKNLRAPVKILLDGFRIGKQPPHPVFERKIRHDDRVEFAF